MDKHDDCPVCQQIREGTFQWIDNEGFDHFAPIMQLLAEHGYSVIPMPPPTITQPPRQW